MAVPINPLIEDDVPWCAATCLWCASESGVKQCKKLNGMETTVCVPRVKEMAGDIELYKKREIDLRNRK